LNTTVYHFQIERDARAVISEEVSPKTAKISPSALLDRGDGVRGEIISGFSIKALKPPRIQHRTSAHRGQFLQTTAFSFAKLDRVWQALANALAISQ
jgi:hypothetical protein